MILPSSRSDQIAFFEAHQSAWESNLLLIGLVQADVDAIKALTLAARDSYSSAQEIRDQSKAATLQYHQDTDKMRTLGASLISTIKAYAEKTGNDNVYVLAQLPPPAPPAPLPAPATPTGLTTSISGSGLMTLTWDAAQAGHTSGVIFLVARRRAGEANFTVLTGVQEPSYSEFIGNACAGAIEYQIRAVRGTKSSDWSAITTVNFVGGPTMQLGGPAQAEAA